MNKKVMQSREVAMVRRIINSFLLVLIAVWSTGAYAGGSNYRCIVERVSSASGDSGNSYQFYVDNYVGKVFTVDRASGVMVGALKNSYVTAPQVIDLGSSENAYKVVTTMRIDQGAGAGSNIYALTIEEFESGPQKPFVFLENGNVFFGQCEHF